MLTVKFPGTNALSGARRTWKRLLDAQSGIVHLSDSADYKHDLSAQQCRIAGLVPAREWEECLYDQFTEDVFLTTISQHIT